MPINNNYLRTPKCLREAGAGGSHRGARSATTDAEGEAAQLPFHLLTPTNISL